MCECDLGVHVCSMLSMLFNAVQCCSMLFNAVQCCSMLFNASFIQRSSLPLLAGDAKYREGCFLLRADIDARLTFDGTNNDLEPPTFFVEEEGDFFCVSNILAALVAGLLSCIKISKSSQTFSASVACAACVK